jgi:hypothetical protein
MTQQPPEEPGTWQAKVFLAYAKEDREVALAVQDAAKQYADDRKGGTIDVETWKVDTRLSRSILDSLRSTMKERRFGIFVYTPVDKKARDNVVFETGLFMGIWDTDHTIILLPENHDVAPSDLQGIIGLTYPYDEVKNADDHDVRTDKMGAVGARIVDRIYNVMTQPSAQQKPSATEQSPSGTGQGQSPSALEMISTGLATLAALGKLPRLSGDVPPGTFVVHAANGVGRVMAFDPLEPRYIEVEFGSVIGRYRISELFVTPIAL